MFIIKEHLHEGNNVWPKCWHPEAVFTRADLRPDPVEGLFFCQLSPCGISLPLSSMITASEPCVILYCRQTAGGG